MDRPDDVHDHDRGLAHDLTALLERRRALKAFAGVGLLAFVGGCGSDKEASGSNRQTATTSASGSDCVEIPEETAGPYPADGSNGVDVLRESGIVRRDIRSSFGEHSGVAEGVPTTVTLTVQDSSQDCVPLAGAAVYLWHCDRDGQYSLYTIEDQNYLRGVQETGADGTVTFTSIFPACYDGRWPHLHLEVYPSVADATAGDNLLRTSQIALPQDVCESVYATDGYGQSVTNLGNVSLDSDMVFSDGADHQMATVTGSIAEGYTITLDVPV